MDIAPTILDMAGVDIPDHMDGQSILRLTKAAKDLKKFVIFSSFRSRLISTLALWSLPVLFRILHCATVSDEEPNLLYTLLKPYKLCKDTNIAWVRLVHQGR